MEYLLRILFNKLEEAIIYENNVAHYQELFELRECIHNSPSLDWSVTQMAEKLNMSEGYLQALYQKAFHISCKKDVINCRISLAKERLLRSSYSIEQIAEACGYRNVEHFIRQFQQMVGMSPTSYRNHSLVNNPQGRSDT